MKIENERRRQKEKEGSLLPLEGRATLDIGFPNPLSIPDKFTFTMLPFLDISATQLKLVSLRVGVIGLGELRLTERMRDAVKIKRLFDYSNSGKNRGCSIDIAITQKQLEPLSNNTRHSCLIPLCCASYSYTGFLPLAGGECTIKSCLIMIRLPYFKHQTLTHLH